MFAQIFERLFQMLSQLLNTVEFFQFIVVWKPFLEWFEAPHGTSHIFDLGHYDIIQWNSRGTDQRKCEIIFGKVHTDHNSAAHVC